MEATQTGVTHEAMGRVQVGLTQQLLDDPNPDTHMQPVFVLRNDGGGEWKEATGRGLERSGRMEMDLLATSLDWESLLTS